VIARRQDLVTGPLGAFDDQRLEPDHAAWSRRCRSVCIASCAGPLVDWFGGRIDSRPHQMNEAVSVPKTARKHFDEDIARAWALHELAAATEGKDADLAFDLARTAVAFGVGALDAYRCDAFTDTLARSLKHSRQKRKPVPSGYQKLTLPIGPLLGDYEVRDNWGLRMAARALMEKDNMLQLGRLKDMFNPALPPNQRLWADLAPKFAALNRTRLTGYKAAEFQGLTSKAKVKDYVDGNTRYSPFLCRSALAAPAGAMSQYSSTCPF
jgi:hypothetical protein